MEHSCGVYKSKLKTAQSLEYGKRHTMRSDVFQQKWWEGNEERVLTYLVQPFYRKLFEDEVGARGTVRIDKWLGRLEWGGTALWWHIHSLRLEEKTEKKLPELFPHDCNLDMSQLPPYGIAFKNGQRVSCKASDTHRQLLGKSLWFFTAHSNLFLQVF